MMETLKNIFSLVRPEMDVSSITRDTQLLQELGLGSLDFVLLMMEIEETYQIQFSGMEHFETVGDVCDYIAERIRENNEPAACNHP